MSEISTLKVVAVTDQSGNVVAADLLLSAAAIHRQLRTHLPEAADAYVARMHSVFRDGAEMAVALDGDTVVGVTVFRCYDRTLHGKEMYCDDLVSDATVKVKGVGNALMQYLSDTGRARGMTKLTLSSGVQRAQAHKFYFREGFTISSFHFVKPL
jgi:GNAT superfamily N-acetyltransferase